MNENDLKSYTVILGNGSGVLFEPLDQTITYVLSAKHVFYVKDDTGGETKFELKHKINLSFSSNQETNQEITILKGQNYFEHSDGGIDAAILILNENLGYSQIFVDEECIAFNEYFLCGFPDNIADNKNDRYSNYQINRKIDTTNNGYYRLQTNFGNLNHGDIVGFSGGGILRLSNGVINIIGIQSSTITDYANGQIDVVPIKYFKDIIDSNGLPPINNGDINIDDFSNIDRDWQLHNKIFSVTINSDSKPYYLKREIDNTVLNYLSRNKNIWISGISGIGKTFLVLGNINKICDKPIRIDLTCSHLENIDDYFEYINNEIIRQCDFKFTSSQESVYDRISDNLCTINLQSNQLLIFVDEVPILQKEKFYAFLTGFINISDRYSNLIAEGKNINWIISTRINPEDHLNNEEDCLPNKQKARKNFSFKNLELWKEDELSNLLKILQISLNFKLSDETEREIITNSKGLPGLAKSVIERLLIEDCTIEEAIKMIKSENI